MLCSPQDTVTCHSPEELYADLLMGDGGGPQQQQGGAEGVGDAVTKQLYGRHCSDAQVGRVFLKEGFLDKLRLTINQHSTV